MKPTIGTTEQGESLNIDIKRLLVTRMLLEADSGGGKTVALKRLLEQTHGHVQQVIIDPEGEFSTLREKFDYLLCAPEGADAIATPKTAAILARKLRETRVSAVIDIYDLRPQEQKHFVKLFIEEMLAAPKTLWNPCLLVIDEAQVFAPENDKAESLGAIMDLRGRGRKRGLCPVLATPRLAELSKDACAGLQNKLIGITTLDLDVKRAARELAMTPTEATVILRNLEPGEFFCFGPALTRKITKVKVGPLKTSHGNHTVGKDTRPPAPSEKIKKVLAELADLPKEAEQEARTLNDFKAEVARLKREISTVKREADPAIIERAVQQARQKLEQEYKANNSKLQRQHDRIKAFAEEAMQFIVKITADDTLLKDGVDPETMEKAMKKAVDEIRRQVDARFDSQRRLLENYRKQGARLFKDMEAFLDGTRVPIDVSVTKQELVVVSVKPHVPTASREEGGDGDIKLTPMDRAILTVLAQFNEEGCRAQKLVLLAGYTLNGSTRNSFSKLRTAGYITGGNTEIMFILKAGLAALGDYGPIPKDAHDLGMYWLNHNMMTPMDRAILQTLITHPNGLEAEPLCVEAGYTLNGSTRNSFSKLRTAGLIVGKNTGVMQAAPELLA